MTILIDVGNTALKWQYRRDGKIVYAGYGDRTQLLDWVKGIDNIASEPLGVSCVRDETFAAELESALKRRGCRTVLFANSVAEFAGVHNAYREPLALGVDRWLALLAMKSLGHSDAVVVDVGTACTIDILDANRHIGGYIVAGPALACASLVANTDKIRFSIEPAPSVLPGLDTGACVVSGAWLTLVASVNTVVAQFPESPLYLTGGGAAALQNLGVAGRLVDDLVLEGLHFWLNGA